MRSAARPSCRSTSPRRELRRDDDPVGAARVIARQSRIVATNLRARPLRMREKIEIVNRDDLCRARDGSSSGCEECVTSKSRPVKRFDAAAIRADARRS